MVKVSNLSPTKPSWNVCVELEVDQFAMRYARRLEHARMLVSQLISYTRTVQTILTALGDFIRVESSSS